MEFVPLIDNASFGKLQEKLYEMAQNGLPDGSVFVPVGPSKLTSGVPRVLFVAMARGGMAPIPDFPECVSGERICSPRKDPRILLASSS